MIAIDTNVLLRYLLADDKAQHHKATKLILENQSTKRHKKFNRSPKLYTLN